MTVVKNTMGDLVRDSVSKGWSRYCVRVQHRYYGYGWGVKVSYTEDTRLALSGPIASANPLPRMARRVTRSNDVAAGTVRSCRVQLALRAERAVPHTLSGVAMSPVGGHQQIL